MLRVLFVGDINVDVIMGGMESPPLIDREVPCRTFDLVLGASTVLCACAYASLGGGAWIAGLAGEDDYGEFMLRGLGELGVHTDYVERTRAVRTGVTVNLVHGSSRTQVTYPGTIAEFDAGRIDAGVLREFQHVHFGGVYLQYRLLPRIAGLLETAREFGLTSSLDPQWDSTARWEHMDAWLPLLSYLFVNEDEAMSITGAAPAQEACRRLAARTACPVVKAGADGAYAAEGALIRQVPARRVEVVDTTGAGDNFDAAFLFATLERGMDRIAAVEFANAAAARACTFVGGTAARSSYRDVLEFMG